MFIGSNYCKRHAFKPRNKNVNRNLVRCDIITNVDIINRYKAVTEINTTPKKTMEYVIPGPNRVRRQWDDTVKVS